MEVHSWFICAVLFREWYEETRAMHALHKAVSRKWKKPARSLRLTREAFERQHQLHHARQWLN